MQLVDDDFDSFSPLYPPRPHVVAGVSEQRVTQPFEQSTVGVLVRLRVGAFVGRFVGRFVVVGALVSLTGATDGHPEGESEGGGVARDGFVVGPRLGATLGMPLGRAVGRALGARVRCGMLRQLAAAKRKPKTFWYWSLHRLLLKVHFFRRPSYMQAPLFALVHFAAQAAMDLAESWGKMS